METQTKYKPTGLCAIIATSTAAAIVFFVVMFIIKITC